MKPASQWSMCCVGEQAYNHFTRVKCPNYSEAHPGKCHLPYTQLLFCLTAYHWYSTQPRIEARVNKRLRQFMYTGLCTNTHTHNLSKHTFTWQQLLYVKRGYTHTCRHTVTHAGKTILVCEDGTNVVIQSIVIQCSARWLLFTQQQGAWGHWEVLGDPARSGDLSLKLNREQQKSPRPGLLNYITVVHKPNCVCTLVYFKQQ